MRGRTPWTWLPTLYFTNGLPHVVLVTLTVVVYLQLGMSDTEIAFYTAWFGLPWVLKPLLRPLLGLYQSKRWWVLSMQIFFASSLAGVAFTLNYNFWLQGTIFFFMLMAFSSSTYSMVIDSFCKEEVSKQDYPWGRRVQNIFYHLAIILGKGVLVPVAGILQVLFRNKEIYTWSLVFYGLAGVFIVFWLYHGLVLPHCRMPKRRHSTLVKMSMRDTYFTFLHSYPIWQMIIIILFFFLFCMPQGLLFKMSETFLLRPGSEGGLGLSPQEFGFASGTVGVIGLVTGGLIGRILVRRDGLRHWLWQMACAITLPKVVYVYLSYILPENIWFISGCVFIEQFGYGFGYTALSVYIIYLCQGNAAIQRREICIGIYYLGVIIYGMISGYLKDMIGYRQFFILIMLLCTLTFIITSLIAVYVDCGKAGR